MHITLRHLRIFEAVAQHSSISRAAAELHLTQPAVSMQMKQLEEQIGIALVEQIGKRLYLTEAGQELRGHARRISAQMTDLNAAMDQFRGLERGLLRLAVVSTANYFIPQLLGGFGERHPGVRVSLQVANREAVLGALADNRTELAITGQPPDSVDVIAQHFKNNPLVVIAAPTHPLAQLDAVSLQQLDQELMVVREAGSGTRAAMDRHFADHGIEYRAGCEMGTNEAVKQAVQAGLGLAVVSLQTIELELETRRLAVLPVATFPILRHWYVVHRTNKRLSAAAQAFREMLLARNPEVAVNPTPRRAMVT
ncbi:MAG: LysR substrate-binding domain-containing protein [Gammaproteobacteria bacterium]|jgi:LysR family transcriptional regulator, low CO2-responsive transcriptional regulator|nr:LysR substrate-binding domain-containing protein [Gammaproteobacteria bacterium]